MMRVGNDDYKAAIVGYDEDKDVAVLKIAVEQAKVPLVSLMQRIGECRPAGLLPDLDVQLWTVLSCIPLALCHVTWGCAVWTVDDCYEPAGPRTPVSWMFYPAHYGITL